MKFYLKLSCILLGLTAFVWSCRNDNNSNSEEDYMGVFKGEVFYKNGSTAINNPDGEVVVNKVGDLFSIDFSDEIPSLSQLELKDLGYVMTNLEPGDSNLIRITPNSFQLIYKVNDSIYYQAKAFRN